jgi:MFS family permease
MVDAASLRLRLRRTIYGRVLGGRDFRLLWFGQVVSNLGTYAYGVAVASALTLTLSGADLARTVAVVLAVQAGSAAVVGFLLAGPIADRFSRKRVMVVSDVVRFVAVASLLFGSVPLLHLVMVAAVLGVGGALFEPSLAASLPSVVEEDEVVAANAVVGGTFYAGVMVGPAIGAVAIAVGGVGGAFALNAASFAVSGILIARTTMSRRGRDTDGRITPGVLMRDLAEGITHLRRSRLAVGIMTVMCLVVGIAGAQATVQIVFVRDVVVPGVGQGGARAAVLALLTTSWGAGMLVGCFATPPLIRYLPRERLIPLVVALAGACVLYGSRSSDVAGLAALWAVAGAMCGVTNVSYESLLQERTLDAFRGRVISTIEAAQEGAYFVGVGAAALFAGLPAARSLQTIGIGFTMTGVIASFVLRPAKDEAVEEVTEPQQPEGSSLPSFLPGMGSWPEWLTVDTPWAVYRQGDVVTLELRWPLVPSDWPRVMAALDAAVVPGVVAVVLPVHLPRGSTVPHDRLERLWASTMERGMVLYRGDRAPARAV